MAQDLGWDVKAKLFVDSSAARAIASRTGLGRMRHVEVRYLWVQEAVEKGRFTISKIRGRENTADVLTQTQGQAIMKSLLSPIGVVFKSPVVY